ncbi:toll/interleukin-1 receptor domain-containing protein [Algoriphagus jejuensis]|uniref:Toll/interleukin-1 receptor domain-containing protein n=1 Tax=Algoriphagus jejuensis TaxID=419934 RepID=A0ABP3YC27_9BACT
MAKAFLSHSSKDKELVEKIATQLGKNNCHYDKFTFEAGKLTLDEIFKGLADTDVFVLFISETALKSEWIEREIIQAKILSTDKRIDRIFPLIIDKSIHHSDERIPDWIRKPYNLRYFDNEVIILKKIRQLLRESNFKQFAHLREINDLFVGRNDIMQEFERKMINIENTKPTCIIASSFFEGMGRRTFLKNGLNKTRIIDKWYEPIPLSIGTKESIEDFLYKLNFVELTPEIFEKNFANESLQSKIELGREYIKKFVETGEILFVIDEGSIVLPNHTLVGWFKDIISAPELKNQVCICLISKFKPYGPNIKKLGNVLNFQVNELSQEDTQTFFIQYLSIIRQSIKSEDIKFFLQYLKGIPGQIIYAANLIDSIGVIDAKTYVNDIEEFDELRALSILEFLKDDLLSRQMLIALSKFEIISYDLVFKIFGEREAVYKSIQRLFDLTLFFSVSSTHDYLKLNTSISDYINRSKLELDKSTSERIREVAKEAIQKPLELTESSDYSEFLFTLETMIKEGRSIPSKYLIPSFVLKSIVKEYNDRQYKTVVQLCVKLLENEDKFDFQIIRETRIWLCLAYCRKQNEKLFDEIKYFNNQDDESQIDYHFLLGFYYRNGDKMDEAESHFLEVLDIDENHSRTKRELVNVYLRKGEYMKALGWAKDNYNRFRTNILHIQAYFTCLIKKIEKTEFDLNKINELLENASKSLDKKAADVYRQMQAEFDFYIRNDSQKAITSLTESLKINSNNYFAFRALFEIYKRKNMMFEIEELMKKYPDLIEFE